VERDGAPPLHLAKVEWRVHRPAASGIAYGAVLALVALGFIVLYKATGIINFAHGDLVALGAYLAVWATKDLGLPSVAGYVVALALMVVVGAVMERVVRAPLRGKPVLVVVIATLAMAIVIRGLIALWQGSTPRSLVTPVGNRVIHVGGAAIAQQRIVIVAVAAVSITGLILLFQRTSFGRQVRGRAADPTRHPHGERTPRSPWRRCLSAVSPTGDLVAAQRRRLQLRFT